MKRWFPALSLTALAGCAAPPPIAPETPAPSVVVPDIGGQYSNFGQALEAEAPETAWDLHVQPLPGFETDTWLVTRTERSTTQSQTRLYRFDPGTDGGLVLRIAVLGDEQQGLAPDALVDWARGEFDSGCTLLMRSGDDGWRGQTDPATCRIDHPVYGDLGVLQDIALGPDRILIGVRLPDPRDTGEAPPPQEFDRVRDYRAWAGVRRFDDQGQAAELVLSGVSAVRSDGRRVRLSEPGGTPMELELQLTYLPWQPGEPDYLRLDAYHADTGALMGYYWAKPGAERIEFNGDWLQIWVERVQPGE